jgi:hypothetical protein
MSPTIDWSPSSMQCPVAQACTDDAQVAILPIYNNTHLGLLSLVCIMDRCTDVTLTAAVAICREMYNRGSRRSWAFSAGLEQESFSSRPKSCFSSMCSMMLCAYEIPFCSSALHGRLASDACNMRVTWVAVVHRPCHHSCAQLASSHLCTKHGPLNHRGGTPTASLLCKIFRHQNNLEGASVLVVSLCFRFIIGLKIF